MRSPQGRAGAPAPARPAPNTRERLADAGAAALADAELCALLLGTGMAGRSALACATELLAAVGGLPRLGEATAAELARLPAVGPARAARLCAALELGRRVVGARFARGEPLRSAADVGRRLRARLGAEPQEVFVVLGLDAKHRVLLQHEVARGTLSSVEVHPREVLRRLVREAAAAFIVAHNHPSGDPAPSHDDEALTRRLRDAGELIGIRLLDHVVVGRQGTFSFAEAGRL